MASGTGIGLSQRHDCLIVLDNDGTLIDSLGFKHSECFIPQFIRVFGLQPLWREVRRQWEYLNLHSATRGIHRLAGAIQVLDRIHEQAREANLISTVPDPDTLFGWLASTEVVSHQQLELDTSTRPELSKLYEWSAAVNQTYEAMIGQIWMFPYVAEVLESAAQRADLVLVSDGPRGWIDLEWTGHPLFKLFMGAMSEEDGSKRQILARLAQTGYDRNRILVIGDSLVDFRAASAAGLRFYPIIPDEEEESWGWLLTEGLELFFTGRFSHQLEEAFLHRLRAKLSASEMDSSDDARSDQS